MRYFPDAVPGTIRRSFYFHVSLTACCWGQTSSDYKVLRDARHGMAFYLRHLIQDENGFATDLLFCSLNGDSTPNVSEVKLAVLVINQGQIKYPAGGHSWLCRCFGLGTSAGNHSAFWAGTVFYYRIRCVILDK